MQNAAAALKREVAPAPAKARGAFYVERVTWVRHWTPSLFSLRTTRDPDTLAASDQGMVTQRFSGVGHPTSRRFLSHDLPNDADLGEWVAPKLIYYPTVTREPFVNEGRITDLIENGRLFDDIGLPPL